MSIHTQPTNRQTVLDYLVAGYDIPEADIRTALDSEFAKGEITKGESYGSFAGYVADQIGGHFGWADRPDFDPDAEDDDEEN